MQNVSAFGPRLRQLRERAGLSQEELAERAGLTANAISALERGERRRPYPHTVQLLAQALSLDLADRDVLIAAVPRRGTTVAAQSQPELATMPPRGPPMIGRREECAILLRLLGEASTGRGRIVMLAGEAGIGKTRLARELAEYAHRQGAAVLWGSCFEGEWQPPYGPWVEALRGYVRSRDTQRLRADLGTGAGPIGRLLPEIQAVLSEVPVPTPLSPDEERFRLYDAVVQLLLSVSAEHVVVIILDDLHWADVDSLRLLRHVARSVSRARLLVLGTYRDAEFDMNGQHPLLATLASVRRESEYDRIALRGLAREEVAEFLALVAGLALPHALVRAIEEETGGNPFYAREVFQHLTEESKVLRREGRWSTDFSIGELGIPEGVRQLVAQRVGRLSRDTGELLRLASAMSGGFGFDVLASLSGLSEGRLLDVLDEGLRAGLIRGSEGVPPRYEFTHAIVRHALYEGLNPDRRARLHLRIAKGLEELYAGREAEGAAELAAQYHASGALPGSADGVRYALAAAEQARSAFAHEKAAELLGMARDLARQSSASDRAEVLCRLAIAQAEALKLEQSRTTTEEALDAMAAADMDPRARAEFLTRVARALKDAGAEITLWEPLVERGLALAGDARDLLWARLALLQDHVEAIRSGPIAGGQWVGTNPEAMAVARADGEEEDYARTLEPLDWRTRDETNDILRLARSWSDPIARMRALDAAGRDLLARHGAFEEARAVYEELLALSQRVGSLPGQGEALLELAITVSALGELPLGADTLRTGREVIEHLGGGHRLQARAACVAAGLAYLLDGDWARVGGDLAPYANTREAVRSPVGLVAAAYAALATARCGDEARARAMLPHVTAAIELSAPTAYVYSVTVLTGASVAWHVDARECAATYRRLILNLVRSGVGDPPSGPFELWLARMAAMLDDWSEADQYFDRARSKLDARGFTHMLGIVNHDQASTLVRRGSGESERIDALLDVALRAFRAHGMEGWASRVAEQKERLRNAQTTRPLGDPDNPAGLTTREVQVLQLIAAGRSNREIAATLVLSIATVERHVANVYAKIGATRRVEAARFAFGHHLGPDST